MYKGITLNQYRNLKIFQIMDSSGLEEGMTLALVRKRTDTNKDTKYSITTGCTLTEIRDKILVITTDDNKVQYIDFWYPEVWTESRDYEYSTFLVDEEFSDVDAALNGHLFMVNIGVSISVQGHTTTLLNQVPILARSYEEAKTIFKSAGFDIKFGYTNKNLKVSYMQLT